MSIDGPFHDQQKVSKHTDPNPSRILRSWAKGCDLTYLYIGQKHKDVKRWAYLHPQQLLCWDVSMTAQAAPFPTPTFSHSHAEGHAATSGWVDLQGNGDGMQKQVKSWI